MVAAVLGDTNEVLPVCAWVAGQYGIDGVYLGVPARIGAGESPRSSNSRLPRTSWTGSAKLPERSRRRSTSFVRSTSGESLPTETRTGAGPCLSI